MLTKSALGESASKENLCLTTATSLPIVSAAQRCSLLCEALPLLAVQP